MKHALFFHYTLFAVSILSFALQLFVVFILTLFYGPGDFFSEFLRHILHIYTLDRHGTFFMILTI